MKNRKSILIVDDDIAQRTMVRIFLEWEYDTFEADDGATAIEATNRRRFDLILMDARTMRVSGLEALEKIKVSYPAIPVIVMTVPGSDGMADMGCRIGAIEYIGKPLNFDKLRLLVSAAITAAETRPQPAI
jgi:two-component system response regulator HydG